MSDSLIPYSPTNTSPPSAQTAASVIQSQLGVSLLTGNQSIQYKIQGGGYNHTSAIYEPINIKTEIIERNDATKPFELTNEMLGLGIGKEKKNGHDDKRNSADTHFTRDTHMRIILGNSGAGVGRNVKHTPEHITGRYKLQAKLFDKCDIFRLKGIPLDMKLRLCLENCFLKREMSETIFVYYFIH